MRLELTLEEFKDAIRDYLVKQGLKREDIRGILFQKPDGSLNYEVEKIEVSVKWKRDTL